MKRTQLLFSVLLALPALASHVTAHAAAAQAIAPDVYFHEGNNALGHCNNGWIEFDDYVLVIDANFPAGAQVVMPVIRSMTAKPTRFVVDTHFHGDHSFGNQLWAVEGAMSVAHAVTREILATSGKAKWDEAARMRPDVAASQLRLPGITYANTMAFDDGRHRVELLWLGVAHTRGDTLVWLPREKILFTGDVCVNGPHNYLGDSDTAEWIKVLEKAKALGAEKVCPGHGPMGGPEVIADQQAYFIELRREVEALVAAKKSPAEVKAAAPTVAASLRKIERIARYVPGDRWFLAPLEKVFIELGGAPFPK